MDRRTWLTTTATLAAATAARAQDAPLVEAAYYERLSDRRVKCTLCPRECQVADRERGTCGVRENHGGRYYTLVYGKPCAAAQDPIEKKPLFHVLPGTRAFSIATAGCNIECRFCQNWEISQFRPEQVPYRRMDPDQVAQAAVDTGCASVAFTYSEPVIFYEYMRDTSVEIRRKGGHAVMISNGYIQQRPLRELLPRLDAVKIDFKAFSEKFYRDICSAHLRPVLDTLTAIAQEGTWLEMVVLLIPTLNDSTAELTAMCRWIVQHLGPDVPVHFTRFSPMYKLTNLPPTPVATLEKARAIAQDAGIHFAYTGNVPGHPGEDTTCPWCNTPLIDRDGFLIQTNRLRSGRCPHCHHAIPGIWKPRR